jgi:hypothetical protein
MGVATGAGRAVNEGVVGVETGGPAVSVTGERSGLTTEGPMIGAPSEEHDTTTGISMPRMDQRADLIIHDRLPSRSEDKARVDASVLPSRHRAQDR